MDINLKPIGFVKTDLKPLTQCWITSDIEGDLIIDKKYQEGISDLKIGQYIFVLFHFNKSSLFSEQNLKSSHPECNRKYGVFSTLSAVRPNPIGMSFLEVVNVKSNTIRVKGLDIADQTPILDIKPDSCPWDCEII